MRRGLDLSPMSQVLIERSVIGWKEFELEVMRDSADNVVIVCSIENIDPMGVHTGDSITVAPAMTLTDREYQTMRDAAVAVIREIGVEAGGCNIQFAVNPRDGEMLVIEMNPRVSRSSALASKATGFPIARIGAKLAVGYRLDEIPNDITKTTPASFEPVLDYVVVKCPRFAFEKFPTANPQLTTQMKSVGESMAIGRTFKEAFQKGLRALEIGPPGLDDRRALLGRPPAGRLASRRCAARCASRRRSGSSRSSARSSAGIDVDEIHELTAIDPWFLAQMRELRRGGARVRRARRGRRADDLRRMKRMGFSDRAARRRCAARPRTTCARGGWKLGIRPAYKMVDTCAGEFPSATPYLYSSYDEESEAPRTGKKSVVILGSGPNRIGQGVEFDYCCVRAALALREQGYETIMINSNPETVSTDFDISDKLYFEPLTLEDVLEIVEREQPLGVIVQLGGQTPLKLTRRLEAAGVHDPRHVARRDRHRRGPAPLRRDRARARRHAAAERHGDERRAKRSRSRERIGYPVLVRPSYVLGGRAMEIVYDADVAARTTSRRRRACPRTGRCSSTASSRTRSRRTSTRSRDGERRRDRRHHAAHRGRRHPLRRLGVRAAAVPASASAHIEDDARAHRRAREGARRRRADQRAVRDQGRRRLRARGESAREPHDSVRLEGDRRAARVARGARDARRDARRTSASPRRSSRRTCR